VAILIGLYGIKRSGHMRLPEENNIPVYETTSQAALVLSKLLEYKKYIEAVN